MDTSIIKQTLNMIYGRLLWSIPDNYAALDLWWPVNNQPQLTAKYVAVVINSQKLIWVCTDTL